MFENIFAGEGEPGKIMLAVPAGKAISSSNGNATIEFSPILKCWLKLFV
jgi:hypothetical protein